MKKPLAIMRGESLFTVKAYPVGHPNPSKFRYAMYRGGVMVGFQSDEAFVVVLRLGRAEAARLRRALGRFTGEEES